MTKKVNCPIPPDTIAVILDTEAANYLARSAAPDPAAARVTIEDFVRRMWNLAVDLHRAPEEFDEHVRRNTLLLGIREDMRSIPASHDLADIVWIHVQQ